VLIALLATIVAGLVAFYVFSRYRFPMVPILVLFSAAGLVELPRLVREGTRSRLGIYALTFAVTAVFVNWRMFSAQKQMGIAYANAGAALADAGRLEEAIDHGRTAIRLRPDMAEAHFNLGEALLRSGDARAAAESFRNSALLEPNDPDTHYKWGNSLEALGQFDAAVERFRASLAIRPDDVNVMNNLAVVLMEGRRYREAVDVFERALALSPDQVGVAGNLAWLLATCEDRSVRDAEKAIRLAKHACDLTADKDANLLDTLATAYAEAGRFVDAARTARTALEAARAAEQEELAGTLERKISEYDARR
jgi:tetratricopeptide (TPR) repeat protein